MAADLHCIAADSLYLQLHLQRICTVEPPACVPAPGQLRPLVNDRSWEVDFNILATGRLEATLKAFMDAGAKPDWAVQAVRTVLAYMTGSLLREASTAITLGSDDLAIAGPREAGLKRLGLPHIAMVAHSLSRLDHAKELDFGIELLIKALVRELRESKVPSASRI